MPFDTDGDDSIFPSPVTRHSGVPLVSNAASVPFVLATITMPFENTGAPLIAPPVSTDHNGAHVAAPQPAAANAYRRQSSLATYTVDPTSTGVCSAPIRVLSHSDAQYLMPAGSMIEQFVRPLPSVATRKPWRWPASLR